MSSGLPAQDTYSGIKNKMFLTFYQGLAQVFQFTTTFLSVQNICTILSTICPEIEPKIKHFEK
jgi:hypothetical protein